MQIPSSTQTRQFFYSQILVIKQSPRIILITYITAEIMNWMGSKLNETKTVQNFTQQFRPSIQKGISIVTPYFLNAAGVLAVNQDLGKILPYPLALTVAALPYLTSYILTSLKNKSNEEILSTATKHANSARQTRTECEKHVRKCLETTKTTLAEKNKLTLVEVESLISSIPSSHTLFLSKPKNLTARSAVHFLSKYVQLPESENQAEARRLLQEFAESHKSYYDSIKELKKKTCEQIISLDGIQEYFYSIMTKLTYLQLPQPGKNREETLKNIQTFIEENKKKDIPDSMKENICNQICQFFLEIQTMKTIFHKLKLTQYTSKIGKQVNSIMEKIRAFESIELDSRKKSYEEICKKFSDVQIYLMFLSAKALQRNWKENFVDEEEERKFYKEQAAQNADFVEKQRYSSPETTFDQLLSENCDDETRNAELDKWEADILLTEDIASKENKEIAFNILNASLEFAKLDHCFRAWKEKHKNLENQ